MRPTKVLFVCLGNICRSPTAEGVFRHVIETEGYADSVFIDSAGTSNWHVGNKADPRTIQAAAARGYDLTSLRGRQVTVGDFTTFDYILAMDNSNLGELEKIKPKEFRGHLGLFLAFANAHDLSEVPDPYYSGEDGFNIVLDLVEDACQGLLQHLAH